MQKNNPKFIMKNLTNISTFVFTFCFSVLFLVVFNLTTGTFSLRDHSNLESKSEAVCDYKEVGEVFSKKHYFSSTEVNNLLGKRVRNVKCGKIKCPISSNNCSSVQINERGKINSLIPRERGNGYIIAIEWDNADRKGALSYAEKGVDKYISYVGKDGTYEILD